MLQLSNCAVVDSNSDDEHKKKDKKDKRAKKDKKKNRSSKELPHASTFKAEDLEQYFKGLFSIVDANSDGVLQPDELKKLLQLCGFALSAKEIAQFVSEADTNHDGVIEYSEFVPVATKMLQATAPKKEEVMMISKHCSTQ